MIVGVIVWMLVAFGASAGNPCSFVGTDVVMSSSISQYGITFYFDATYKTGQFVNGDFWVVGPVIIKQITPEWDGKMNGYELNSVSYLETGFDYRIAGFNASLVPPLPLKISTVSTIVKAVSVPANVTPSANQPWLQTAVVLTILDAIPAENGSATFRPPYFGLNKVALATDLILWDKLPGITVPANVTRYVPTLDWVVSRFQRLQLDNRNQWTGINMHPIDNMPNYGSNIAHDTADGSLRLMLNDIKTNSNGTCAMIMYLQYGIDLFGLIKGGNTWPPNGGHMNGRKLPATFAAYFLNYPEINETMQLANKNLLSFSEDSEIYKSPHTPVVLWGVGINECESEEIYWAAVNEHGDGSGYGHYCRDPYGYIDGTGKPGTSYQWCCTSLNWKAAAVSLAVVPELQQIWNNDLMLSYVRRWVNWGAYTLPDPCAPTDFNATNYGKTYGPDGKGSCIKGSGRFPSLNGTAANSGGYASNFCDAVYPLYL